MNDRHDIGFGAARMDDPFAQDDAPRTFVKPNPGARTAPRPRPFEPAEAPQPAPADLPDTGLNPLVGLANPLLLVVPQLRLTRHVDDPEALRQSLAAGVRAFVAAAHTAGLLPERVMAARYVLCTMLDEAAADTPRGGSGVWGRQTLLAMFHNETGGGEKVFQLMARLAEQPAANRDLLELIYAAVSLGFEGRYRVVVNGRAQLEAVRDKLATILKTARGPHADALAHHWQAHPVERRPGVGLLPLAATAAVALGVLVVTHLALSASLNDRSDPVFAQIGRLRLPPPVVAPVQLAARPRLAQFLQADVKAGLIAVRDDVDRSVVTLRGDGLFAPASAALEPGREALLGRIGDALARVGGAVLVTGHTDRTPMRSARFPSNWHLSQARADSVRDLLVAHHVPAGLVTAEGRADSEPVEPDDTPAHRAQNRRVEVTLAARPAADTGARPR